VSAQSQTTLRDLDEGRPWIVAGRGITVEKVDRDHAPPGIEGEAAVRCQVDETLKGQAYLRCDLGGRDLSAFSRLRFRLFGGLDKSFVGLVTLIDSKWRHRQWPLRIIRERSQAARWTEFVVLLSSPVRDRGADLRDIRYITWFVSLLGGGEGTKSVFIDGVAIEADAPAAVPGHAEVVLENDGQSAVFRKSSRFELGEFRLRTGRTVPVATSFALVPLDIASEDTGTIRLGAQPAWHGVEASRDRLRVDYTVGSLQIESTFQWEGDALEIRRRVTCLRDGFTGGGWRPQIVRLDEPFTRFVHDHGAATSEGPLPVKSLLRPPGNWFAGLDNQGAGVAVIFPRCTLQTGRVEGCEFSVFDRLATRRCRVKRGTQFEYTLWLLPMAPDTPASRISAATQAICQRLVRDRHPLHGAFGLRYQPFQQMGHTLVRLPSCTLWQASPSHTVEPDSEAPSADGPGARLYAARGEVEPLHLAVRPERRLGLLSVSCSAMRSGEHTIPRECWRVRYPAYMVLRSTTEAERAEVKIQDQAMFVGEIDNGLEHLHTDRFYGRTASVLGPVEDPLFSAPPPVLEAGRNQPLWLTVSVPVDAAPGAYRGEIVVREGEKSLCRIPVELTIWSFSLPKVTSLRTWYQLWRQSPAREQWRAYYRNLAEHKVSGFGSMPAGAKATLVDGKVSIDWTLFDRAGSYLFDELGLRHTKLPYGKRGGGHRNVYSFLGFEIGTPEFEAAFHDYLVQAREHLLERGWLQNIDCYIFDEPDEERIEAIRQTAPIVRRAIPEMRIFPACARNTQPLVGILNAWCPPVAYFGAPLGDFTPERVAAGRARGEVFWWYNQEDNAIGCPVVTHRALPWASWQAGLTGYFVWAINYWECKGMRWSTVFDIGEAMALYPGKDGPVDSLRWEQTREGLEDYDYLVMLEQAATRGDLPAELLTRARKVLSRAKTLFPDPRSQLAANPEELLEIRHEIGTILDTLSSARRQDR